MHFLIDASLPRPLDGVLRGLGHDATDVRELGVQYANDLDIARFAQINGYCIISRDFDFADIRVYPPEDFNGIAVISVHKRAKLDDVIALVVRFVSDEANLVQLPGRLAIVEPERYASAAAAVPMPFEMTSHTTVAR